MEMSPEEYQNAKLKFRGIDMLGTKSFVDQCISVVCKVQEINRTESLLLWHECEERIKKAKEQMNPMNIAHQRMVQCAIEIKFSWNDHLSGNETDVRAEAIKTHEEYLRFKEAESKSLQW